MGEQKPFRDAILDDEGVQRLLERLAIAEQFHAVMLMCDMPRVANAVVDILMTELPRMREQTIHLVRIDPYRAHKNILAPIALDLLIDEVLAPLVHPPAENQGSSVITVVDASRAMPQDDDAWGILFQRMNERRNAIGRALASALVFFVPTRYKVMFAHAAPDFWSILGASIVVQTPLVEDELRWMPNGESIAFESPPFWARVDRSLWSTDVDALQEAVRVRREELRKDPFFFLSGDLLTCLSLLLDAAMHENRIDVAVSAAKEAVIIARRFLVIPPYDNVKRASLADELIHLGCLLGQKNDPTAIQYVDEGIHFLEPHLEETDDPFVLMVAQQAYIARGYVNALHAQFATALVDLQECNRLAMRHLALYPDDVEPLEHLAFALLMVGNVHVRMNNVDAAIDAYTESIGHWRKYANEADDSLNTSMNLARALGELGDAYRAKGDLNRALAAYEEAAETSRCFLQRNPMNEHGFRRLLLILTKTSEVHFHRGDLDRGLAVANEGVTVAREWFDAQPNSIDARNHVERFLAMIALGQDERTWSAEARA